MARGAAARVILNHATLDDILKSEEVFSAMRDIAEEVVAATPHPEDYEIVEWLGRSRARVSIRTVDVRAHVREARDHNLVRALGGGSPTASSLIQYTSRSGRTSLRTQAEIDNYTRNRQPGG